MIVMAFVDTAKMSVSRPACMALNLWGGVEYVFVTYITDVHRSGGKYREKRRKTKKAGIRSADRYKLS